MKINNGNESALCLSDRLEHETPLAGRWHHGNGVIVCGSLRIAREDFDTSPSEEVKAEILDWICDTLNKGSNA
jgi:hypothetical protein